MHYLKSWRTALSAALVLICVGLYFFNVITGEQLSVGVATLTAAGLLAAQDSKKNTPS